jgi:hypothetical protein
LQFFAATKLTQAKSFERLPHSLRGTNRAAHKLDVNHIGHQRIPRSGSRCGGGFLSWSTPHFYDILAIAQLA